eukprot:TRINITY_DN55985_c0_g1_i1.p1 TRINITY_DN55985_c0_g1~~TRINITY_DN55985_c0_g1_i1.p1  ORF type:complete len:334 (+),score=48.88 TRINITY_DN55985_c0_g1_i1:79-1002(+)
MAANVLRESVEASKRPGSDGRSVRRKIVLGTGTQTNVPSKADSATMPFVGTTMPELPRVTATVKAPTEISSSTVPPLPITGEDKERRGVVISGFERKAGLAKHVAEAMERGVFKAACPTGEPLKRETLKEYTRQYKRLCTHLRQNGNLAKRLTTGEIDPENVAAMDDEALITEAQRTEIQQHRQQGLHEALGESAEDSAHWTPSDSFACPRCECVKCVYISWFKGSHSYDDNNQEPSITIRCTDCKHLWKEDEVEGGRAAAGSLVTELPAPQTTGSASEQASSRRKTKPPSIWGKSGESWLLPAASV